MTTTAARQQAGFFLAVHRAYDATRAILQANGITPHKALSIKTLMSGDTSIYGNEAIAMVAMQLTMQMQVANGIDQTLDALLNEDTTISEYKPYNHGVIRGENPSDYIDRDFIAAWQQTLHNLGVREDGSIHGLNFREGIIEKKLSMGWAEYLNR